MSRPFLIALIFSLPLLANAQVYVKIVFHEDLIQRQIENTAVKQAALAMYGDKLDDIMHKREKITFYMGVIEEIQRKIVSSLANIDDAIKNGKTLYWLGKKIPDIYNNLQTAIDLAIQKPFLAPYAYDASSIITARLTTLVDYVQNTLANNDWGVLISQTKRDKFIKETYDDIMTIYWMSNSMVQNFKTYTIQDAVNKIIPYKVFLNKDKAIVTDIVSKFKF